VYSNQQLNAIHWSKVGFEFEFFSNLDLDKTKESLTRALSKKIKIEEKAHSEFVPTENTYKLEPDNSGGTGMIELVTGPMKYPEAKLILAKTLRWIKENGYTNDRSSIHINLAFDLEKLGPKFDMKLLDIGKFVLSFDEDAIFKLFPDRKDSVYSKSIKFVMPINGMTQRSPGKLDWKNYQFANEKYYGVNFTKIPKNYIEFRYLGGKDYENKYPEILKLMDHFIVSLYHALDNPIYNKNEEKELDRLLDLHKGVIKAYKSLENFTKLFPKIKLMVDLQTATQIVKMYYPRIREALFQLLTKADMKEGLVNYDSDQGRIQVKNAKLNPCFLVQNIDLVECEIQGNIIECDLFQCNLINSSLIRCNLFGMTEANDSKIESCYTSRNVELKNCYVYGIKTVFSGEMKGGIFRKGRATKHAQFDKTEVIEIEKIK
tara:strand:- start:4264 stop:5559 length:1296 start_codon:yes stop_codon:yes gene_type:complete